MALESNKKLLLLYILDVMKEYSDAEHQLTQSAIIEKVKKRFGMDAERKAIARNIDFLVDFGYDIVRGERGYYLAEREFDSSEIIYLVDSVYSSKAIPSKAVTELVRKLAGFSSRYERKAYKHLFKPEVEGGVNKQYFFNIDVLNNAIDKRHKVKFNYISYKFENGEVKEIKRNHIVSPFFMVNNNAKYYLVCNKDGKSTLSNYKIENIVDIEELEEDSVEVLAFAEKSGRFDENAYIADHIYMFGGEIVHAKIKLKNDRAISAVYEWFGKNTQITKDGDDLVAFIKADEQSIAYWAVQYAELVTVLSPVGVVGKIKSLIEELKNSYS